VSRLPIPNGDAGNWGDILNDFLSQSLNSGGGIKTSALTAAGAELTVNKGLAGGYAPLNNSTLLPSTYLGTGTASGSTFLAGDNTWQTINQTPSGIGDYMGVFGSTQSIVTSNYVLYQFDNITTQTGNSTSWDNSAPDTIAIAQTGVYAVNVTIFWQDPGTGGTLSAQLFTSCGFMTQENRPAFTDSTNSVQNISGTFYLQQGQNILLELDQTTGVSVTPTVWLLTTRVG
jgi:hypothetical protein